MTRTLFLLLLSLTFFGCKGDKPADPPADPPPTATPAPKAQVDFGKLGELAKAVKANPDEAQSLLGAAGYTLERFEAEIVAIAQDPEKAAAWTEQMQ